MMKRKPLRILYVTSCWPHDRTFGGQLRALQIGRALSQFAQCTVAVVGAHEVDAKVRANTAAEFEVGREIKVGKIAAPPFLSRVASLANGNFTTIHGVVADPAGESWLLEAVKQFDLVWFFKLRTANYFANPRWRRSVVDIDDLPSTMELRRWHTDSSVGLRLKAGLRTLELRRHEGRLGRRFDVLGVCSKADQERLNSGRAPVHVIPNGFTRPVNVPNRKPADPPRIGFMGLYSYEPNLNGIRWFIDHCWKEIKKQVPGVRLRLVGLDTDGPLKPVCEQIDGLGWLKDPAEEVSSWSHMIVPIRVGAGTRVKIADAFSRKCPVVSTRFGALGYEVENGRELHLADNPRDFINACVSLLKDRKKAADMSERAYQAFLEKWTWDAIAPRVWDAVTDCLRSNFKRS